MRNMKQHARFRGFAAACIALLVLSIPTACSGGGAGTSSSAASSEPAASAAASSESAGQEPAAEGPWTPAEPISIRYANWMDTDRSINGNQMMLDAYMAHQPDVSVELVQIQWDDARTWLTMQLTAGTAPELFHSKLPWAQEDLNKGLVYQLNGTLARPSPYMPDYASFSDTFAPSVTRQLPDSAGNIAAVCAYINIVKVFYNKAHFADAGIDGPPQSWNEFMDAQQKLLDKSYVPFSFPNSKPGDNVYNWVVRLMTWQLTEQLLPDLDANGDTYIRSNEICRGIDEGIIDLTAEPFKNAFPLLKDWSKYWSQGYNSIDAVTAEQIFIRQEASMFFGFPSTIRNMEETGATFDYGVFTFPYLTKENDPNACEKKYEMGSQVAEVYCIPAGLEGDTLAAAEDLMMFMCSAEAMKISAEELNQMPVLADKVTDSLDGWAPEGEDIKFNFYGPAIDQKFADDTVMFGQLYIEGKISLEEYTAELQTSSLDMCERLKTANGWTPENNYLIDEQ